MQIIKKYGNRKLYHTNEKRYITLEGVAELIGAGQEVQVIDNVTGEDITIPTLSQILLQNKTRRSGLLPIPLLADLIQAGGDTFQQVRHAVLSSLGGRVFVEAEIRLRLQRLLDAGALSEEECQRIGRLLLDSTVADSDELVPASRSDVERLRQQVEELAAMVDDLLRQEQRRG